MPNDKDFKIKNNLDVGGGKIYLSSTPAASTTEASALVLDGTEVKTRELSFVPLAGGSLTGGVDITSSSPQLFLKTSAYTDVAQIKFSSNSNGSYAQFGTINFDHTDTDSYGSAALFEIGSSESTTTILADGKLMYNEGIYSKPGSGTGAGTRKDANWDAAYNDKINSASFGTGDGVITLNQQDSGTVTVDIDGRFETISNVGTYFARGFKDYEAATEDLAVGWYTIATINSGRASARFSVWEAHSSRHQTLHFYASHHYGTDASNNITVIHASNYNTTEVVRHIRIKDLGTYDGAALQVYVESAANLLHVAAFDDVQSETGQGWVLKNFIADGTDPGGVSLAANSTNGTTSAWSSFTEAAKVDLQNIYQGGIATTGDIYASGRTAQYRVLTTNDEGSGNGIDADTVDSLQASSFLRSDADDSSNSVLTLSGGHPTPLIIERASDANANIKFTSAGHTTYLGLGTVNGSMNIGTAEDVQGAGNRITTVADKLSAFASTTSAELAGKISDETGTGTLVFNTSPSITTPTFTGLVTLADEGYSIGNEFHIWKRQYSNVTTSTPKQLYYRGTTEALPQGGVYRFTANLVGTSTNALARAVFWYQDSEWRINVTGQSGTTSNHPEFFIDASNGPSITLSNHSSNYDVEVLGERLELGEGSSTDNVGIAFGADSFLGSTGGVLRYASAGISATGVDVYDNGVKIPTANDHLGAFAATTSAQLRGVINDETGSGSLVFATSPTLVTPALGTPASGDLQNCTFPDSLAPKKFISSGLSVGTYKRVARVTGNQLGSMIRASFSGVCNNAVVAVIADIIVNHSGDIHIMSQSSDYHPITIKVFSNDPTVGEDNGDEDFDLYVKYDQNDANSAAATMTLKTTILSLGDETVTANPTDTAYSSGTSHEHTTTDGGVNFTQSSGNADIVTDGNVTATNFLGAATSAGTSTHVTVTDNESENEENLITFVENAQSGTGSHGLEMDGNLTYNPNTGTITSTKVSTTNLTATDGSFTGTVSANSFSKLSGKPVEEITVGTKIQSQNTLAPRVVTNATSKIFYAALENNTRLYKNNELLATLSKGTSSSIAAADISLGDIIHSDRPVSLRQNGKPLASLAATGSFFIARTRGGSSSYSHAHFGVYPPYADGRIKYIVSNTGQPAAGYVDFSDSNAYDASSNPNGWQSFALTQGTVGQLTIASPVDGSSVPVMGFYWLQSDTPVVITQTTSNSSTWTGHQTDAKLLKQVSREVLSYDEGTQTKFDPDNTGTITVSNSGSWRYSRSDANLLFAHNDEGDGDGSDGTQGIPWKMCGDSYIIDHGLRGYQIATIEPSIISAYYWNGSAWVLYKTHDFSTASRDSFSAHAEGDDASGIDASNNIGQSDADKPWRFIGTGRFALRVNTPAASLSLDGNDDDEYFVLGYDSDLRSQDVIRVGKIVAEDISAATITGDKIASNTTINVGPAGATKVGLDGTGNAADEIRIFAGHATKSSAPFQVKHNGALVATDATITGAITANSGTFTGAVNASSGAFTGNVSTAAAFTAGNSGIDGAGSGDDAVRIFAGNALADKATAEFRVTNAGAVNATNANITGTISASDLTMSDPSKVLNLTAGLIADGSVKDTSFDASGINKIEEVVASITGLTNGDYQSRPSSAPAGSVYGGSLLANDTAEGFISNLQITDFAHGSKNPLLNLAVLINLESSDNAATVLNNSNTRLVGRFGIFASINGGADTQIGSNHDLTLTTANATLLSNGNTRYTFVGLDFVAVTHSVPGANNGDTITYKVKLLSTFHQNWQANKVSGTYEVAFIVSEAPTGEVATLETDGSLIVTKPSHGDATLLTLKQSDSSADMDAPSSFIDFVFTDSDSNETPQARISANPVHNSQNEQRDEGQGRLAFLVNNSDTTGGAAGTSLTEHLVIKGSHNSDGGSVGIGETGTHSSKLTVGANLGYQKSVGSEISELQDLLTLKLKNGRSVDLTTATGASIEFTMPTNGTNAQRSAAIAAMRESNTDSDGSTGLAFFVTQNDTTLDEAVRIDHDMNVGIGTSSITAGNKLEVVGKIDASGDNGTFCTDHWTLPHADGSNGQVLTTNGSGAINWATPVANTFRTIKVDTSNNGTADETLGATEELQLIGGTAVTLAESGGVVTINSSDTNTTYGISAVDSSNDVIIRLTDSGGTNDDVKLVAGDNITITPSSDNITIAVPDDITSGSFVTDKAISNDYNNSGSITSADSLEELKGLRGAAAGMTSPHYGIASTGLIVKQRGTYEDQLNTADANSDGFLQLACGKGTGGTNTTHHTAALKMNGSQGLVTTYFSRSGGKVSWSWTGDDADTNAAERFSITKDSALFSVPLTGSTFTGTTFTGNTFITNKVISNDYNNSGSVDINDSMEFLKGKRGTGIQDRQYGISGTGLQVREQDVAEEAAGTSIASSKGFIELACGAGAGGTNTSHHTAAIQMLGSQGDVRTLFGGPAATVEFSFTGNGATSDAVQKFVLASTYAHLNVPLTIKEIDSSSDAGPILTLKREDNDADGDKLGQLLFQGDNDASTPQTTDYASITTHVVDESDGSEDGKIVFDTITDGSQVTGLEVEGKTLKVGNTIKFDTSVLTSRSSETNLNVQFALVNSSSSESVLVLDDFTRLAAYAFNLTPTDGVGSPAVGSAVASYADGDHSLFADHIYSKSSSTYFIDLFTTGMSVHPAGDMRVRDDQYMGFGTHDDAKLYYDDGNTELELELESTVSDFRIHDNGTTRFNFARASGDFTATGNVTAYSDERLKSDIKSLDPTKTLQMRGVEFTKDGKKGSGVIAQELEKVAPELVLNEGEYKSVAYGNLSGYLIETIKDQQKQIDELKALVEKLVEKL